ncbi:MAG: hypothetical protein LBR36_06905 [Bacteroidales bacterium]|nr:hypothetical protein [Bacteroidales bacterium]
MRERLQSVIADYMQSDDFQVDSIQIYHIDSLTELDFQFLHKQILINQLDMVYEDTNLYGTDTVLKEKLEHKAEILAQQINFCNDLLSSPQIDTVNLRCFFVASKIFGKDKTGQITNIEIGFPINTNFKVEEIRIEE